MAPWSTLTLGLSLPLESVYAFVTQSLICEARANFAWHWEAQRTSKDIHYETKIKVGERPNLSAGLSGRLRAAEPCEAFLIGKCGLVEAIAFCSG
jgi:hypothetical protein